VAGSFILLSAVSCQQAKSPEAKTTLSVTPTISETFTAPPFPLYPTSWSTPNTKTPTPTAMPFHIFLSTPQYSASNYHLRPWAESDSNTLINRTLNLDYSQWDPSNLAKAKFVFEAERLLRFPNSPNWFDSAWDTALVDPHGIPLAQMRPGQTFFSYLVEHLLNQEGIKPEQLPDALEKYGFHIYGSIIQVDNLFGDGQEAFIFVTKVVSPQLFGEFRGVFGLHYVNERYQVETLMDWGIFHMPSFWLDDSLQVVGDINGDGIPEVIVEEDAYWSAMSGDATDTKDLNIFEWQSTQQVFAIYDFFVYKQHCGDPPICKDRWEWKFGEMNGSGTRPLIVTKFAIHEGDATGQPNQVSTFTWSEISQHPVNPGSDRNLETDQITVSEHEVERLLFQERDFPAAIIHIKELLAKIPPNSTNQPDRYDPYLRYLLGIAYELNAQPQQAVMTYYQLWLDDPGDIFGAVASLKLEQN